MKAAATPQWAAYKSTSYAPAVRQLAAAVAAAAQCPTYRPHWQMNVAMWMRMQCGLQNYTNAIDLGQCDADVDAVADAAADVADVVDVAVAAADVAAVVVVVASDDAAAAAVVGNGCSTFGQQRRHCWHWGPVSCYPDELRSSFHHCSSHAALSRLAYCWDCYC